MHIWHGIQFSVFNILLVKQRQYIVKKLSFPSTVLTILKAIPCQMCIYWFNNMDFQFCQPKFGALPVLHYYPYIWGIGEAKRLFSASNLPHISWKGEGKALGCIIFLFGTWIPRHISLAAERWAGREDDHLSEDSAGSKLAPQAASWNIQDSILWEFPLTNIGDTF